MATNGQKHLATALLHNAAGAGAAVAVGMDLIALKIHFFKHLLPFAIPAVATAGAAGAAANSAIGSDIPAGV